MKLKGPNESGRCAPGEYVIEDEQGNAVACGTMPDLGSERGGGGAPPMPPRDPLRNVQDLIDEFGREPEGEVTVEDMEGKPVPRAKGGIIKDFDRYMKKKRTKKYQMGGIASLTRDPRLGGAVNPMDGYNFGFAQGGMAAMPEYAAGGKLLRGPGDGMSDDIPAVIRGEGIQRAALADGEFVIPADVVSHLGNGSTEAGARKLYKMMAQIRRARTGRKKQAPRVNPDKFLPRV